ncbi:MAG: FG-GAP-like repeat-containing protein [Xanthobacteraceae bacterium]
MFVTDVLAPANSEYGETSSMATTTFHNTFETATSIGNYGFLDQSTHRFVTYQSGLRTITNQSPTNLEYFTFQNTASNWDVHIYWYETPSTSSWMNLYNSARTLLTSNESSNPIGPPVHRDNVAIGQYYLEVQPSGAGGQYAFGLIVWPETPSNYSDPAGSSQSTAQFLRTFSTNTPQAQFSGSFYELFDRSVTSSGALTVNTSSRLVNDGVDYYKFTLAVDGQVAISTPAGMQAYLLGPPQGNIGSSFAQTTGDGRLQQLVAGDYYVAMYSSSYSTSISGAGVIAIQQPWENYFQYTFGISFTPGSGGGGGGGGGGGSQDNGDSNLIAAGNGHSYRYISFNGAAFTWDQAAAMATAMGGYLATIGSDSENAFITNNVISGHLTPGFSGALFGAADAGHEGLWTWATGPEAGAALQYTNWAPGEPNGGTGENYGLFGADGRWVDVAPLRDPAFTTGFVIEYSTVTGANGGHGVGDFNKDGTSDLIWYNQNNRNTETWLLNNGHWAGSVDIGAHPAGYFLAGTGDFNKDGTADLFWFNPTTRDTDIWLLNNGHWAGSVTIGKHPAGSQVMGTGDFNKDGTTDVLWLNPSTMEAEVWLVNNGKWAGSSTIGVHPAGYQIAGTGDFNKDGTTDVLWFNPSTRETDVWLVNNGKWAGSVNIGTHPAGYQVAGTGDFNKDGTADVLWYNSTSGDTDIWLLNNGKWAGSTTIGIHPGNYQVAGVGDFNKDGTSDVAWFNPATNDTDVWLVVNGHWAGSVSPGAHPGGWMVV